MTTMQTIMMDGREVPFDQARIHVLSPAVTYAASVFEGIRMYWNDERQELYVFRLREHLERLQQSMRMMWYDCAIDLDLLTAQTLQILRSNAIRRDSYARIMAVITSEDHPNITSSGPVSILIAPGLHDGAKAWRDRGMRAAVSTWARVNDRTHPPRIKATANYANGRLGMLEAKRHGYDASIMLTADGKVAEAPVASIFMVRDGCVITPPVTDGILESVTRATVIDLCRGMGMTVQERSMDRTELYVADELFFCASALEIAPIQSVDDITLAAGAPGPMTRRIRDAYEDCVRGRRHDTAEWLTPVYGADRNAR